MADNLTVGEHVAIAYAIGALVTVLVGCFAAINHDQRTGARIIILSLLWPILAALGMIRGARELWEMAEWGQSAEEESGDAAPGRLEATVDVSETDKPDLVHGVIVGPRCEASAPGIPCQLTRHHRGNHRAELGGGRVVSWFGSGEGVLRG